MTRANRSAGVRIVKWIRDRIDSSLLSAFLILLITSHAATAADDLRSLIAASPELPYRSTYLDAQPPAAGWESGMVSWVALDNRHELIYEIQRGDKADPVLVLDRAGKVVRSWGKGDYKIPHSIRIDPSGNVWTVDAGSSTVIKYSPTGRKLMTIEVGEQPAGKGPFSGTTDIAFGPHGHLFITDGYGNARVLEYTADGKRVKQWGQPGTGPGELHLPHAIRIVAGMVYVADRENGRIEKFDLEGRYVGEIDNLGRVYSLEVAGDVIWACVQEKSKPAGPGGWLVKLDRETGKILGHLEVSGLHSVELSAAAEPIIVEANKLLWLKPK
jgi:sugar lactone lactonase YvrE